jgi:hypothetical protein
VRNIKIYLTLPLLFLSAFSLILVLGIPRPAGATEAASRLTRSRVTPTNQSVTRIHQGWPFPFLGGLHMNH